MIRITLVFFLVLFFAGSANCQDLKQRPDDYPVPPKGDNHLFYIQRNRNKHTILYDANLKSNGRFDEEEPILVYWLRYYSTGIEKRDLKWVEKKFAYGYSSKKDESKDAHWVHLAAFDGRKIHLEKSKEGKPVAILWINDSKCRLDHIYVYADESGSWPKVIHVDLYGVDLSSGKMIHERILNH